MLGFGKNERFSGEVSDGDVLRTAIDVAFEAPDAQPHLVGGAEFAGDAGRLAVLGIDQGPGNRHLSVYRSEDREYYRLDYNPGNSLIPSGGKVVRSVDVGGGVPCMMPNTYTQDSNTVHAIAQEITELPILPAEDLRVRDSFLFRHEQ
jgi:hypothetical protein